MGQLTLFEMPEVERAQVDRKDWRWAIPELLAKAGGKCYVCGGEINGTTGAYAWVEHIVPIALGGKDEWENLSVSHPFCNMAKRDYMLDDPRLKEAVPKLRAMANKPLKDKACVNCGASISHKGYSAYMCDGCARQAHLECMREYVAANRETINARSRAYQAANRETINARNRERYAANKETINARMREYRAANKETINARKREYRAANKETINARNRERYAANKETINARNRAYQAANRETINARKRERYAKTRPDRLCLGCGVNINHRGSSSKRCEPCQREHKREYDRKRKNNEKSSE